MRHTGVSPENRLPRSPAHVAASCVLYFYFLAIGSGRTDDFRRCGLASYAVIGKAMCGHRFGMIQITSINNNWILQAHAKPLQIESCELFPLRQNQEDVGALCCLVRIADIVD